MRRREFITLLGGAAAAWPLAARAQQKTLPEVGFLLSGSRDEATIEAFRKGLSERGFVEDVDVKVEYRWAEDRYDRLPQMIADLVRRQVNVIVASGSPVALAAKAATSTIPIIFYIGVDPVEIGLVSSLNRPGGNLTGISNLAVEMGPKRLELLHGLIPTANSLAALVNSNRSNSEKEGEKLRTAAGQLGLQLEVLHASTVSELDTLFPKIMTLGVGGLIVSGDPFFNTKREYIGALGLRYRVPVIYQYREFAVAGGLVSYGASQSDMNRIIGVYVGRVLKGEKPGDLPVQQAAKIELIINLKTAKAIGVEIPPALLARADEVIE
jgi:putative tryptophan/tyrosine transport system substrate-binding protein